MDLARSEIGNGRCSGDQFASRAEFLDHPSSGNGRRSADISSRPLQGVSGPAHGFGVGGCQRMLDLGQQLRCICHEQAYHLREQPLVAPQSLDGGLAVKRGGVSAGGGVAAADPPAAQVKTRSSSAR